MQEPERGMLVRVLEAEEPYFKAGTLARLIRSTQAGGWWASFEGCGNEPDTYKRNHDNSTWHLGFFEEGFEPANLEK